MTIDDKTQSASWRFSRAGYWPADGSPRQTASFNDGWLFSPDCAQGDGVAGWERVSLPHSIDPPMMEASGCVNRQRRVAYVKRFVWRRTAPDRRVFLHFEAVMGRSEFFVNGRKAAEHFGGWLPVHFEITDLVADGENMVRVECDNSDDPSYPPGKPQRELDFCYFGGIYRDVWLIETGVAAIAEPSAGGVRVETTRVADGVWRVGVSAGIDAAPDHDVSPRFIFEGREVGPEFTVRGPAEWTPDAPNLHFLDIRLLVDGRETDAVRVRFGFREISVSSSGLTINGRPWRKLVGVNRHQDFAYLGNALSNSLHWRDAKKYRDAGFTIIRNAHYPQDPAFMDACDELGLFVIENTPGWQFWNDDDPCFAERVYDDIRHVVRRDATRPSVLFWEPILNETRYPADFAARARGIVREETRGRGLCACDSWSEGARDYDIIYDNSSVPIPFTLAGNEARFVREWGDCVDDWDAQNSPSRVAREWGEGPMLVQARHYLHGTAGRMCLDALLASPSDMIGGCIWHGADHARGYHPDNFLGGLLTYDRRKKYSWHAMKCALADKPHVFVANALAPYSPQPVEIWANRRYEATWLGRPFAGGAPRDDAEIRRLNNEAFYGEGVPKGVLDLRIRLDEGEESVWKWARRFVRIDLELDTNGLEVSGDGDDMVVAVATLADAAGTPRRYSNEEVVFEAEGCDVIGPARQRTRFGEATVVLRTRGASSPVRLTARLARRGLYASISTELRFTPGNAEREIHRTVTGSPSTVVAKEQEAFGEGR